MLLPSFFLNCFGQDNQVTSFRVVSGTYFISFLFFPSFYLYFILFSSFFAFSFSLFQSLNVFPDPSSFHGTSSSYTSFIADSLYC